jgi:hypothetical protein
MKTIAEYLQMIPSQYQKSTKFLSWLSVNLQILIDANNCLASMPAAFDLDNAVGTQLDILGIYLGQNRTLPFNPTDGSSPTLDDATYRQILKLRTMTNYWDGSLHSIYKAWNAIFTGATLTIIDNKDMTATVTITGEISQIILDMAQNDMLLPRPEGVAYNYGTAPVITPLFAYDYDDGESPYFEGYDEGYWDSSI